MSDPNGGSMSSERITPEQVERGDVGFVSYPETLDHNIVPVWWLRRLAAQMRDDAEKLEGWRVLDGQRQTLIDEQAAELERLRIMGGSNTAHYRCVPWGEYAELKDAAVEVKTQRKVIEDQSAELARLRPLAAEWEAVVRVRDHEMRDGGLSFGFDSEGMAYCWPAKCDDDDGCLAAPTMSALADRRDALRPPVKAPEAILESLGVPAGEAVVMKKVGGQWVEVGRLTGLDSGGAL